MNYKIESYDGFYLKIKDINCKFPQTISFLPENFSEATGPNDFIYSDSVNDLIKVFKASDISTSLLDETNPRFRTRKTNDWLGPAIFIGFSLISENPNIVAIALNVLSNYLTDFFRGGILRSSVKFDLVIETKQDVEYRKITYDGSVEGIKELVELVKTLK